MNELKQYKITVYYTEGDRMFEFFLFATSPAQAHFAAIEHFRENNILIADKQFIVQEDNISEVTVH